MTAELAVAIGAAAISGLALVLAWRASQRADQIQERLARVEEARRRDELGPTYEIEFTRKGGSALNLRVMGPQDLDGVELQIVQKPPIVLGFRLPDGEVVPRVDLGEAPLGRPLAIGIREGDVTTGGNLTLRVRGYRGADSWEQVEDVFVSGRAVVRGVR